MSSTVIKALSPPLRADYLKFFDRDAFVDDPKWASCYCHFYHAAHDLKKWEERTGEENRQKGVSVVEAYPRKEAGTEAANYHGPLQMYLDAGFQFIGETEGVVTVRKTII